MRTKHTFRSGRRKLFPVDHTGNYFSDHINITCLRLQNRPGTEDLSFAEGMKTLAFYAENGDPEYCERNRGRGFAEGTEDLRFVKVNGGPWFC